MFKWPDLKIFDSVRFLSKKIRHNNAILKGENHSNVYQAQGNLVVNSGLDYSAVKDLCQTTIQCEIDNINNALRSEFESNVHIFWCELQKKLPQLKESEHSRFATLAVQASIAKTARNLGIKNSKEKSEYLIELITARANSKESIGDKILDSAIDLAPQLEVGDLQFLALCLILTKLKKEFSTIEELKHFVDTLSDTYNEYNTSKEAQEFLMVKGCFLAEPMGYSLEQLFYENNKALFANAGIKQDKFSISFNDENISRMRQAFKFSEKTIKLIDFYNQSYARVCFLLPIGKALAFSYLSKTGQVNWDWKPFIGYPKHR